MPVDKHEHSHIIPPSLSFSLSMRSFILSHNWYRFITLATLLIRATTSAQDVHTELLSCWVFWFEQSDLVRPLSSLFALHLIFTGAHRAPLLITAQESSCVRRPVVHKEENFKDNNVEFGDEDHDDENLRGGERKRALTRQAMLAGVVGLSHVSLGAFESLTFSLGFRQHSYYGGRSKTNDTSSKKGSRTRPKSRSDAKRLHANESIFPKNS